MTPPLRGTAALRDSELETFRAPQYFDFSAEASSRTQHRSTSSRSATNIDDIFCNEQFIPGAEGINIFRAHEVLVEYPEVQGIVRWLDGVRTKAGLHVNSVDVDLTNGIALVDAMGIISPKLLNGKKVARDYVRPSSVADHNVALLRATLACFPWRDEVRDISVSPNVDFADLSPWSLAGYVLAAAVNCPDREKFIEDLMQFDMQTQDLLDSTVQRAYKALGISYGQEEVSLNGSQSDEVPSVEVDVSVDDGEEEAKEIEEIRSTLNTLRTSDSSSHSRPKELDAQLNGAMEELRSARNEKEVLKAQVCDMEEEITGLKEHTQSLEKVATDMAEKSQKAKDEIKKLKAANTALRKKLETARKEMITAKENQQFNQQHGGPILRGNEKCTEHGTSTMVKKLLNERHELIEKAATEKRENVRLRRQIKEAERRTELAEREIDRLHKIGQRTSRRSAPTSVTLRRAGKRRGDAE